MWLIVFRSSLTQRSRILISLMLSRICLELREWSILVLVFLIKIRRYFQCLTLSKGEIVLNLLICPVCMKPTAIGFSVVVEKVWKTLTFEHCLSLIQITQSNTSAKSEKPCSSKFKNNEVEPKFSPKALSTTFRDFKVALEHFSSQSTTKSGPTRQNHPPARRRKRQRNPSQNITQIINISSQALSRIQMLYL